MEKGNIKNDILAGITVAIVALPLALAFGVVSGAGAVAGLYGAIILGFFAALFGGVAVQVSGPTGPMTVVTASAITAFPNDFQSVMAVVFFAGLIQISFGLVDLGKWVKFIPYPIISGFMCGIGVIIIILQINPILGLEASSSIIFILKNLYKNIQNINYEALLIAILTLIIMFFTPKKISKIIPSALIALFLLTSFSSIFSLELQRIGEIPSELPDFIFPISFDILQLNTILTFAITLAVLGSVDTQLTSVFVDSRLKTSHNSKKELIAQGVGNTLCSFFGAIPGAGATMRTVVNMNNGAKTRISGMTHSVVLLLIALFFAPLASKIPLALLAGILIKVGFDILDYRFIKIIKKVSKDNILIMLSVFLITIFVDLIMAVALGLAISSILALYKISVKVRIKEYKSGISLDNSCKRIDTIKVEGPLFFTTSIPLEKALEKTKDEIVIINCLEVTYLDISAILKLEDIVEKFKEKNKKIILLVKYSHKKEILSLCGDEFLSKIDIYTNLEKAKTNIKNELENV